MNMFGMKINYLVKNSNGGILGGTKTLEQAEAMKARWEREYATNPFGNCDLKVYIVEA